MSTPTDKKPTLGLDLDKFTKDFMNMFEMDAEELAKTPPKYAPDAVVMVEPIDPGDDEQND